jgi:hypothetical protein
MPAAKIDEFEMVVGVYGEGLGPVCGLCGSAIYETGQVELSGRVGFGYGGQ